MDHGPDVRAFTADNQKVCFRYPDVCQLECGDVYAAWPDGRFFPTTRFFIRTFPVNFQGRIGWSDLLDVSSQIPGGFKYLINLQVIRFETLANLFFQDIGRESGRERGWQ